MATAMLAEDKIYVLADNQRLFGSKAKRGQANTSMGRVITFAREAKLIKKPVTPESQFDTCFVAGKIVAGK
jgi:hypothetical protein